MDVLIVGEAPGRGEGPPLAGAVGARIAELMGISLDEYLARFERRNLLDERQERSGKGTRFPLLPAAIAAAELRRRPHTYYLLLGKRVAAAFGFPPDRVTYLHWYEMSGDRFAVLPHPSGIVRWWNEPRNVRAAREFLRKLERASRPLVLTAC